MFDNKVLAEPAMAVDPVHDARHILPDVAMGRESIPYIVVLPEEQIAFFTYTWVSKDSVAGAALAVFGPGVGGPPIQQRLADRPVPKDMGFDAWAIDGFRMVQHLKFDRALRLPSFQLTQSNVASNFFWNETNFALAVGSTICSRLASGKPTQGITIDHASTQRIR